MKYEGSSKNDVEESSMKFNFAGTTFTLYLYTFRGLSSMADISEWYLQNAKP